MAKSDVARIALVWLLKSGTFAVNKDAVRPLANFVNSSGNAFLLHDLLLASKFKFNYTILFSEMSDRAMELAEDWSEIDSSEFLAYLHTDESEKQRFNSDTAAKRKKALAVVKKQRLIDQKEKKTAAQKSLLEQEQLELELALIEELELSDSAGAW